jgi:hypothetical protein
LPVKIVFLQGLYSLRDGLMPPVVKILLASWAALWSWGLAGPGCPCVLAVWTDDGKLKLIPYLLHGREEYCTEINVLMMKTLHHYLVCVLLCLYVINGEFERLMMRIENT